MFDNVNAPLTLGANVPPNMPLTAAPMPTYTAPAYGYGAPVYGGDCRNDFVLIVVLFILLIIVGACVYGFSHC